MPTNLHEIESQARLLSESERARLALALIESLENQDDGDVAEDWRVEVERRWSEIQSGAALTVSAIEVFAEIRHSLK
jgi:putative addiction module component (TIGR02574 family)